MAKTLSEHSMRAIGPWTWFLLDFAFCIVLLPLLFFCSVFHCLSSKIFFLKMKSAWESQGCAFPSFQKLISVPRSVKKKQVKLGRRRDRGRERLVKEIRVGATQSNGWQAKQKGRWRVGRWRDIRALDSERRERIRNQKYHAIQTEGTHAKWIINATQFMQYI